MLLQFLQTLIIFKKIFGPQYTELICSATTIHLPASPTYCCFTTLGKQANWFVITLATKLTHNRCTKLKKICSVGLNLQHELQMFFFICCHFISPINHLIIENHSLLIQISMHHLVSAGINSSRRFIPPASPVMPRVSTHFLIQLSVHLRHQSSSPLSSSITPSLFHSRLKTYLFDKSFLS